MNLFASWGIDSLKLDGCYCNASEFSTGKLPDNSSVQNNYQDIPVFDILF